MKIDLNAKKGEKCCAKSILEHEVFGKLSFNSIRLARHTKNEMLGFLLCINFINLRTQRSLYLYGFNFFFQKSDVKIENNY